MEVPHPAGRRRAGQALLRRRSPADPAGDAGAAQRDLGRRPAGGFLAFHHERGLAPDPVRRTWVIRVDGRAAGALRLEPGPAGAELRIWLGRTHRGRGVAASARSGLLADRSVVAPGAPPLVTRTTAASTGALALLRALGAVTAPGGQGRDSAALRTDDHRWGPAGGQRGGSSVDCAADDDSRRSAPMSSGIERPGSPGSTTCRRSSPTWSPAPPGYQRVLGRLQRLPLTFPHPTPAAATPTRPPCSSSRPPAS
ncbi:GNAT family N-acetyltransferase [Pseudonocardia sp. MCCB 268]|nr:GNAT family N-acetyltransferase [Pseudonocardia cytotoxica]